MPLYWNWLRNPDLANYRLGERSGWLRLQGTAVTLNEAESPTFVGRRQQHHQMLASVELDFSPVREGDEAGLTVLMNNRHHYEVAITREDGCRVAITRRTIGSLSVITATRSLPESGTVTLSIEAQLPPGAEPRAHAGGEPEYVLSVSVHGGPEEVLDRPEMRYIATEVAGGFTGAYLGMYATGNGALCSVPADFARFRYEPLGLESPA